MKIRRVSMPVTRSARPRGGAVLTPRRSRVSRSLVALLPVLFVFGATFAPVPTQVGPVGAAPVSADPMPGVWVGATTSISAGANGTDIPVTQPGTNDGIAEFHYNRDLCTGPTTPTGCGGPGIAGSWTFNTTAATSGRVHLDWQYSGFHAYAGVTVDLQLIVHSPGHDDVTIPLAHGGPISCCTPPSSGFTYVGSNVVDVAAGDTFGFALSGGNGDNTSIVRGDLLVAHEPRDEWWLRAGHDDANDGDDLESRRHEHARTGPSKTRSSTHRFLISRCRAKSIGPVPGGTRPRVRAPWSSLGSGQQASSIRTSPRSTGKSYRISYSYSANPDRLIVPVTDECGPIRARLGSR